MRKHYIALVALLASCLAGSLQAQVVLEDFENNASTLAWEAIQGSFEVVMNPDTNRVNGSGFAGAYTKDTMSAFSLFQAILNEPLDLSVNNQLFVDVYASEDTRFIAKLEGGQVVGQAIEGQSNIPVANQWRRYRFDFSGASNLDSLTRILFFFDFGNEPGGGTYIFDNVTLGTSNCAGVDPMPLIIDDFECQRTTIQAGFDSLFIVDNPAPDAVNGAGPVGEFRDPPGEFAALVYNRGEAFDLQTAPVVKMKYWAPQAGRLLVKLEGGTSGGQEVGVDVTEVGSWQEYSFDFSAFAGDNFRSLTIFTNAGVSDPGKIYYFDDIRLEAASRTILDDFEDPNAGLFWRPASNNTAVNGAFDVIANPDMSGLNTTANTGQYIKGSAALGILEGLAAEPIDLSTEPQINLLVWASSGATEVRLSAVSTSQGRVDVTAPISVTEEWTALSFSFADIASAPDVTRLELIFDPGVDAEGRVYYFDEVSQGASTLDPCADVVAIETIVDNFECQRNATITGGADRLEIIDNPDPTGNISPKVGQYTDPNDQFSALVYQFDEPIDLSVFSRIAADIWSPKAVPLGFKLEDSDNGSAPVEIVENVTTTEEWVNYTIDFSAAADGAFKRLVIFFNFAQDPGTDDDVYFIDNLRFQRGPVSGCVFDFETSTTQPEIVTPFAGGAVNDTAYAVIPNPDQSGINLSDNVGKFTEGSDGLAFAGIAMPLGAPIVFPDPNNQTVSIQVWAPRAMPIVLKLELPNGMPGDGTGDVFTTEAYDTPGEWKELVADFSTFDWATANWQSLTFIPGIDEIPMENTDIYFDNVRIGGGMCIVSGIQENRKQIQSLRVFPNPTEGLLFVETSVDAEFLQVFDALGRQVLTQQVVGQQTVHQIEIGVLTPARYVVVVRDREGLVLGRSQLIVK